MKFLHFVIIILNQFSSRRMEAYEELTSRFELYSQIKEGMDDIATGNTRPFSEAMADIRSRRSR